MQKPPDLRQETIGVVGCGLIGASWTALFLAFGASVRAFDPRREAEAELRAFVLSAWSDLQTLGFANGVCDFEKLHFSTDLSGVCQGAGFIQESGPDRLEVKRDLIAKIEACVGPDVIIASSTSSILPSDLQQGARHPERILVAHPMNPPHLVPMVELVAGRQTSPDTLARAAAFYRAADRVVIEVKKEVVGHLANRLTSALYREAVHLVAEGIASVEDVDKAVAYGPGMRWAFMGPHLIYHLGGGAAGYRGYLEHLGDTQEIRWNALGTPTLDSATREKLIAGVEAELLELDEATLRARRDKALVQVAMLKRELDT